MPSQEKQTPEGWKKVKEALDAALEVANEERLTVLERHLDQDLTLLAEAKAYLGLEDEIGDFIEKPALSLSPHRSLPSKTRADPMIGRRVGPYKLESVLGRGGMGAVYLAVREDHYEKRVAIKLIHQALSSGEMVERFRKERQILAHLEHPNIARLLDGGATDDGLPYLVMEFVEGRPIDRYCDEERLSVRKRLKLFLDVCSAVHFAHRNLVVHRDLKPGNILVSSDGVPKLLDFGIAKLLGSESVTQMVDREVGPMTYQYASPEQVMGEPISTGSDVYSLGVLLYEILSGHLPFKREQYRHPLGLMKAVGAREPPKPSTAIWREEKRRGPSPRRVTAGTVSEARRSEAGKLQRVLSGDVDAIALKALRREPEHRYGSVEQLSEDLRRHLDGRPVEARAGTFSYRAGKFIRRYRLSLATAAVFLTMIVAFMIMLARQRDRATMERDRATMSMDLLVEFLENPDLNDDEDLTVERVIERGVELFGEDLARDLEAQANALSHLGLIYSYRALFDKAQILQEGALKIRREKWGESHHLVAETLINLAYVIALQGDYKTAESLAREAVEIQRQHYTEPHRVFAKGISNHASYLRELGQVEAAWELYHEALEMKRKLYGAEHPAFATSLANLGTIAFEQGKTGMALRYHERALQIRQKHLPADHKKLAVSFNHVGRDQIMLGQYQEAASVFRTSLDNYTSRLDAEHPDVAGVLNNLAFSLERLNEFDEAKELYERALRIRLSHFEEDNPLVATVKRNLASLLISSGDPVSAEKLARSSLSSFVSLKRERYWRVADARSILGACLSSQGRFAEAEPLLLESLATLEEEKGDQFYTRDARHRLFQLYSDWGRPEKAMEYKMVGEK